MLAGCQTVDPYTRETKTSNATQGALIGAAAGAGVGALTGVAADKHVARNALIGAGVGALGGGAIGYYMDQQEAELRRRLDQTGVRIQRNGDRIELVMPGHVTFDTGAANIRPRFRRVLDDVAIVLEEYEKTYVRVEGHTDSRGSSSYNQELSAERVRSVAGYLGGRGILDERFILRAYGESQPIASNASAAGRQQNRRVEINLIPHT
jgi:outer membrane protein OmpA-like peptidoglycan-associated protein